MAVLLEVYFYSPDNSITSAITATLEVVNVPNDLMMVSPEPTDKGIQVRIDVRGPRPLIEQMRSTSYHLIVNYPPGRPLFIKPPLDVRQLWLPVGVEVVGTTPSDLSIEFEPILSRELPIVVENTGRPKAGFVVSEAKSTPPSIRVSGPAKEVSTLSEIHAEEVNVSDLSEPKEFEAKLVSSRPHIRFSPATVKVLVTVNPVQAQATFDRINVRLLAPYGYAGTVEPSRVRVILAGPPEVLSDLTSQRLELRADARSLNEGKFQVRLKGELPQGVSILTTDPDYVTVQLMKQRGS